LKAADREKLREMELPELRSQEKDLSEKLFRMRMQKALGQIDNALKVRETRRQIARLKTLIRQKELAQPAPAPASGR
jgi:large subunit ribosomal protein L29